MMCRVQEVQIFRCTGFQVVTSHKITIKKTCHLNFRLPLTWLVAPELLQLLELLNSFPIAFRPGNGPFIVKACHTEVDDVIDVTGFFQGLPRENRFDISSKIRDSTSA